MSNNPPKYEIKRETNKTELRRFNKRSEHEKYICIVYSGRRGRIVVERLPQISHCELIVNMCEMMRNACETIAKCRFEIAKLLRNEILAPVGKTRYLCRRIQSSFCALSFISAY